MSGEIGSKILVIGVSGSGKSTLARRIAKLRHFDHIELDALYWEANWTPADPAIVRERLTNALAGDNWVCDGNYSAFRDITWSKADTVIWLEYGLFTIFWRLFWRTLQRGITREKLWNGNRESLFKQFLPTDDSLFVWAFKTYFRYAIEYSTLLNKPENKRLKVLRFSSPTKTERWLTKHLTSN